ncbi:MAG: hypothetical protein P8Y51_01805 [Campylobacterales bacterium]
MKRTFYAGVAVALFLSLVARAALLFWLPVVQDRMYGNKEAVAMLERHRKNDDALYADHLTMAALITYYSTDHAPVRIPTKTRFSQYDLWDDGSPYRGGLYLAHDDRSRLLEAAFQDVTLLETETRQRGLKGTKTYYLYRVEHPR